MAGQGLARGLLLWPGNGPYLTQPPQQIVARPLLYQLVSLKPVNVDPAYLYPPTATGNAKELPLVGAAKSKAGCHHLTLGHLILYGPEEVFGESAMEVADL